QRGAGSPETGFVPDERAAPETQVSDQVSSPPKPAEPVDGRLQPLERESSATRRRWVIGGGAAALGAIALAAVSRFRPVSKQQEPVRVAGVPAADPLAIPSLLLAGSSTLGELWAPALAKSYLGKTVTKETNGNVSMFRSATSIVRICVTG